MDTSLVIAEVTAAFGLKREADLARLLGLKSPGALSYWKQENRIPWRRWFQIQNLAKKRKVTLPASFFAQSEAA